MILLAHIICTAFSLSQLRQLIIFLMLLPALSHAEQWDVKQLMHDLAQVQSSHAFFVEKKSIAMLTAPIESSGELIYKAPNHLEKRTLTPKPESMILDNDTLTIELHSPSHSPIGNQHGQQKHRIQLQNYPEIGVFIDSIRGTLAGDLVALQQNYQLHLEGNTHNWVLLLSPHSEKMRAIVQTITITGTDNIVRSIEISQTDGDSSLMLIEPKPSL